MNIILLITGLGVGGAERQVCDLADEFARLNHKVMLVSVMNNILLKPSNISVEINCLNFKKGCLLSYIIGFLKLRKIIKSFKPDVLHSHMVHANIFARLTSIFISNEIKIISTAHSSNEGGRWRMLAYRLTDGLCDLTTNVSQEAVDSFIMKKASPKHRIVAVHNGVDVDKFYFNKSIDVSDREKLNNNREEKKFLAVGRLVEAKDYPNLLYAFSILAKKKPVKLIIAGDGPLKVRLLDMCKELGINNQVDFLGVRDDIPMLMNIVDYFVLSSAWEGFGLVVAEAMASEKIVVATDSGGVAEVVGDAGFLVPIKDHKSLAEAMEKAIHLTEIDAKEMRKKARERIVCNYGLDNIASKWIDLYKSI